MNLYRFTGLARNKNASQGSDKNVSCARVLHKVKPLKCISAASKTIRSGREAKVVFDFFLSSLFLYSTLHKMAVAQNQM